MDPTETRIFTDLIGFQRTRDHQTFLLISSPLCLANTVKGRERNRSAAVRPPRTVFSRTVFPPSEQNSKVCVDIYMRRIRVHGGCGRPPRSLLVANRPSLSGEMERKISESFSSSTSCRHRVVHSAAVLR